MQIVFQVQFNQTPQVGPVLSERRPALLVALADKLQEMLGFGGATGLVQCVGPLFQNPSNSSAADSFFSRRVLLESTAQ